MCLCVCRTAAPGAAAARFWGCSATCCHRRPVLGTPLAPRAHKPGDTPGRNPCSCLLPDLRISAELLEKNQVKREKGIGRKAALGQRDGVRCAHGAGLGSLGMGMSPRCHSTPGAPKHPAGIVSYLLLNSWRWSLASFCA